MWSLIGSLYTSISVVVHGKFVYVVRDVLDWNDELLLEYLSLLYWPILVIIAGFVLPLTMLFASLYASALFLTIYKWRSQIQEADHHDFWDGARKTLARLWEAQASIWHGYDVVGLENIPDSGPALIIFYHGAVPIDMYYMIAKLYLIKKRLIHPVVDKSLKHIPGLQTLSKVFGVEMGNLESCISLLKDGNVVAIAPGGVREAMFSHDYKLIWNNRTGFAKAALASGAPIIPLFTANTRQAYNSLSLGASFLRYFYERTKVGIALLYGGFPVKLRTYIGRPIKTANTNLTPAELSSQVSTAINKLVEKNQRQPGSIIMALLDRIR